MFLNEVVLFSFVLSSLVFVSFYGSFVSLCVVWCCFASVLCHFVLVSVVFLSFSSLFCVVLCCLVLKCHFLLFCAVFFSA